MSYTGDIRGSRVYYQDNGPNDLGTVLDYDREDDTYLVKFDTDLFPDWYDYDQLAWMS